MTKIIEIHEKILAENQIEAAALREQLSLSHTVLINVMASPGAGKTTLLERTIEGLRSRYRFAVVEADLDSTVDADKISALGIPAVQIETGGFCHVESFMTNAALGELDLPSLDVVFLENVGNLICPSQFDTGAHVSVAILSVPEGDDKPLKYPIMFRAVEAVVVNKMDYLAVTDFDVSAVRKRIAVLNEDAPVIPLSCRTGGGLDGWIEWIIGRIESVRSSFPEVS